MVEFALLECRVVFLELFETCSGQHKIQQGSFVVSLMREIGQLEPQAGITTEHCFRGVFSDQIFFSQM